MISPRSFPITALLFSSVVLYSQELLDPFSGLEDFLHDRSDLKRSEGDVGFYADLGYLNDSEGAETKLVLNVWIPCSELRFFREDEGYSSNYRVSIYWKDLESGVAQEEIRDENYHRKGKISGAETFLDFQTSLILKPGRYKIEIEVEDKNIRRFGRIPIEVDIPDPRIDISPISTIFLLKGIVGPPRFLCDGGRLERFELNGLRRYRYGIERIGFFVEFYGSSVKSTGVPTLKLSLVDSAGTILWTEEKRPPDPSRRCYLVGEVGFEDFELGKYCLTAILLSSSGAVLAYREKSFYVRSSDRWIEDHFEVAVDYLQNVGTPSELEELKSAPPDQRLKRWREFWEKRDPLPSTPVNESLVEYFRRLKFVNRHFSTHIERGWRTDRGRVYLTLGPPDEIIRRERQALFGYWEIWVYDRSFGFKTVLYFEDRGFTDDFRLLNPGAFIQAKSRLE